MADDIKERNNRTLHERDGKVKVGLAAYLGIVAPVTVIARIAEFSPELRNYGITSPDIPDIG